MLNKSVSECWVVESHLDALLHHVLRDRQSSGLGAGGASKGCVSRALVIWMGLFSESRPRVEGLVLVRSPRLNLGPTRLRQRPLRRIYLSWRTTASLRDVAARAYSSWRTCVVLQDVTSSKSKGILRLLDHLRPLLGQILWTRSSFQGIDLHLYLLKRGLTLGSVPILGALAASLRWMSASAG